MRTTFILFSFLGACCTCLAMCGYQISQGDASEAVAWFIAASSPWSILAGLLTVREHLLDEHEMENLKKKIAVLENRN